MDGWVGGWETVLMVLHRCPHGSVWVCLHGVNVGICSRLVLVVAPGLYLEPVLFTFVANR